MAQSFIFKIGSLDLADYCRVGPDEGMDPYSQSYMDPVFDGSSSSEGQALTGIDVQNRQQAWPVFLKGTSKDLLHDLVIAINREIQKAGGRPLIEWRDVGAGASSFWDTEFVRFDPDYNLRRGAKGYIGGFIRVWCQPPYAHTNTDRQVVSVTGGTQGPVVATIAASSIEGDVGALTTYTSRAADVPGADGRAVVISRLDHPSMLTWLPAASVPLIGMARVFGASGAPGSQFLAAPGAGLVPFNLNYAGRAARVDLAGAVYGGRQRIMAAVRPPGLEGMALSMTDNRGQLISPTSMVQATRDGWQLADLGAVSVPSGVPTSSFSVSWGKGPDMRGSVVLPKFSAALPGGWRSGAIAAFYIFPEDSTTLVVDNLARPLGGGWMSGSGVPTAVGNVTWTDDFGNSYSGSTTRFGRSNYDGLFSFNSADIPFILLDDNVFGMRGQMLISRNSNPDVSNFGLAPVGVSSYIAFSLGKTDLIQSIQGMFHANASFPLISLDAFGLPANSQQATLALQPTQFWNSASGTLLFEFVHDEDRVYANMRLMMEQPSAQGFGGTPGAVSPTGIGIFLGPTYSNPTTVPVACVGFTATWLSVISGQPWMQVTARFGNFAGTTWAIPWYQFEQLGGRGIASDFYEFDGVDDKIMVSSVPSTGIVQDRTAQLRGRIPQVQPSGGRIIQVRSQLDGGPMNMLTDVTVAVRERFFLAR